MDKPDLISVYFSVINMRRGLCCIYIPAEVIDVKPGEVPQRNYNRTTGNWFIRLFLSCEKSNKKFRLTWKIQGQEVELEYYNEILKLEDSVMEEMIPDKIPFSVIETIIREKMSIPNSIIYGDLWK